jgi:hypothetical protein
MDEAMTKTDAQEALSAYIDGELAADEVGRLEAVLADDAELATELDGLRELAAELESLPEIQAPDGFLAAVMARVDAGELGEVEGAGNDVVDFEAERRRIAAIRVAAAADEEPERPSNVVFLNWWIKGPAIIAMAALVVVGLARLMIVPDTGPPPMMAAAPRASSPVLAEAPAPTGLADGDAFADAGTPPLGLGESSPDVAVGFTGSPAPSVPRASPTAARRSGIRVASESARPQGIYAADYEIAPASETEGGEVASVYAPEPNLAEPDDSDGSAEPDDSDGVSLAEPDDSDGLAEPDDSDGLAEPDDSDGLAEPDDSDGRSSGIFGMARSRRAERDDSAADVGLTTGTLRVEAKDALRSLEAAVRARGWTIRYLTPHSRAKDFDGTFTSQTIEIAAGASEDDLRSVIGGQGSLSLGAASPGTDGVVRIRLTIVHTGE